MFRKAFIASSILFAGLAISAMVNAQDPGAGQSRSRGGLVDQLARIRDELSGRAPANAGHQHDHANGHDHEHDHDHDHAHDHGEHVHDVPQPTPSQPSHIYPQQTPTVAKPPATTEVYDNPFTLPEEFQPALRAQPIERLADQSTETTESTPKPLSAQPTPATPSTVVPPASPRVSVAPTTPPATTQIATDDAQLTLQEKLARLIQGGDPQPRSATASGPSNAAREPAHVHDHDHDHAEPLQSGTPTPAASPIQTNPLAGAKPSNMPNLATDEPTPATTAATPTTAGTNEFLYIEKSPQLTATVSGPKSVNIGRMATYTVVLQNIGAQDAGAVSVTLELPKWVEVSRAAGASGAVQNTGQSAGGAGSIVWRLPAVVAQSRERLELDLIPRESRPLELSVQVSQAPMIARTTVDVKEPKVQVVIAGPDEVPFGESKIYQLTVSNPGDGIAENVIIELLPLSGQKSAVASHRIGKLSPGDSKTIDIELSARQAGTLSVKAQATAEGGLASNVEKTVLVRRAGLQLEVEAPEAQYASTPVKYLIHVKNPGNATARGVKVSATLPPGAELQQASAGGQSATSGNVVNWTLDSLAAQDVRVLELECVLDNPGVNRLQVVSDADTDLSDAATTSTEVVAVADLKLEISDPQGPVAVGDQATYTIHVRNRGTKAAESVDIVSFFSEGVEPVQATGSSHQLGPGQVTFQTIDYLGPGEEKILVIKAQADREGNHSFRTELVCRPLDTRLIAEETTRFYGGQIGSSAAATPASTTSETPRTAVLEPIAIPDTIGQ